MFPRKLINSLSFIICPLLLCSCFTDTAIKQNDLTIKDGGIVLNLSGKNRLEENVDTMLSYEFFNKGNALNESTFNDFGSSYRIFISRFTLNVDEEGGFYGSRLSFTFLKSDNSIDTNTVSELVYSYSSRDKTGRFFEDGAQAFSKESTSSIEITNISFDEHSGAIAGEIEAKHDIDTLGKARATTIGSFNATLFKPVN